MLHGGRREAVTWASRLPASITCSTRRSERLGDSSEHGQVVRHSFDIAVECLPEVP